MVCGGALADAKLSLLASDQVAGSTSFVGLVEHFRGEQLERPTVHTGLSSQVSLHSVIRLAGVCGPSVKHYFSGNGAGIRVPVGRLSQIGYLLQIIHAIKMREHGFGMTEEVRKNIVDVSCSLHNVTEYYVQVHRKILRLDTITPEGTKGLLLQIG